MKVKSNVAHVFQMIVPQATIVPGINYITDDPAFLKHPHVQARIKAGLLEVLDEDVKDVGDAQKDYKSLLKDIPNILDIRVLEKIKETDKRASVLKAVEAQMEKLREGRPKDEDAEAK